MTAYESPDPGMRSLGERGQVKLGRYEVVRELGKGAMGIVYLAKDPLIGRLVALKTIRTGQHSDDDEAKEFQQRFVREAQAAGILNHPAIVTVHDIGQDDSTGVSFIAMEYVEGQNLKEALTQGRPLNFDQIGDIVAQVAEALDFAHAKGIVHRDVKPANIILLEGNRAKITDFGIAKIASGAANLTSTGQFLGTPNYMAPEQIKGAAVDGRTDIFSLGICLYECLTRRKPFGGDSLTSISYKIVHESFPPLHEINPQIPEGYEDVVAMCLAKDPSKRYQRGKDMAAAIRAVIRGERPSKPEPMMADETVITRGHEKIPTIEIPFPDAQDATSQPSYTATSMAAAVAAAAPSAVLPGEVSDTKPSPRAAKPVKPRNDPRVLMRKTLDGVRAYPLWYRRIRPEIFFGIIGLMVLALIASVVSIKKQQPPPSKPDSVARDRMAAQQKLHAEAQKFEQQGNYDAAYAKYEQLLKMAPGSPKITQAMSLLNNKRQAVAANQQQLTQAKQLFDEGLALYNNKQYGDAIPKFEESFHLNANSEETANYLKLAQQADDAARADRAKRQQQQQQARLAQNSRPLNTTATTTHAPMPQPTTTTAAVPAKLTTLFNGSVTDGYITVKVGSQVAAYENLWQETGRFLMKRKVPRAVNVTKELTPANADVEVWIVIPSLQVQEHKVLHQNFLPGASHTLSVTYDAQSKRFDYRLN